MESALDENIGSENVSVLYHLKGIVVHLGQGYSYGHYFSLIKSRGRWIKFDDNSVEVVDEKFKSALYGNPTFPRSGGMSLEGSSWPTAYMLLYEANQTS